MVNGRLYDAETMNETGNYERKRTPFFFEMEGSADLLPLDAETMGHLWNQCSCRH
jgi:hypothetical protein